MHTTLQELSIINRSRCEKWHKNGGLDSWTPSQWAVAMAGEAGEVCNAIKKLNRIEDEIANLSEPDRQLGTREEAIKAIGEECADTFLYLELLCQRLNLVLEDEIQKKFNKVSRKYGFPERI